MLYEFFLYFGADWPLLNVVRYISFRSIAAFIVALVATIFWGKFFIAQMKRKQFGQVVRDDGPKAHLSKAGTPTMGGVFLMGGGLIAIFLMGNFHTPYLWAVLAASISTFVLGAIDDYLKISKKNTKGVSGKFKLSWQFATGFLVSWALINFGFMDGKLYVPFVKYPVADLGHFYALFAALVVTAASNAVNLTDGLDGLVIGPVITTAFALGVFCYLSGHRDLAQYLFLPHLPGTGEIVVVLAALIGACSGFLWYNFYPAQIFMGDAGALSLGGLLGTVAVITKNEVLFVFMGIIFVAEAVSVILQVGSFKIRKKRIFKMAPLHHHFELLGLPESKVMIRFWIVSLFAALLALCTIKMR